MRKTIRENRTVSTIKQFFGSDLQHHPLKSKYNNTIIALIILFRVRGDNSAPIVLIGNKLDQEHQRVVSTAQGEELAKHHGWSFYETSAKERFNFDDPFYDVARKIVKQRDNRPTPKK